VAFQVFGDGPLDVLFLTSWLSNVDVMWDDPRTAAYFSRLGRFARVVVFDKRGTGVSDPVPLDRLPLIEEWIDDALAALDEAGVDRVSVLADGEGGPMALVLAASDPDRVSSLALVNSFARWQRADDYPIGMPEETGSACSTGGISTGGSRRDPRPHRSVPGPRPGVPSVVHPLPAAVHASRPGPGDVPLGHLDRRALRAAHRRTPTLVMGRTKARHHRIEYSRYLAEHLPDARSSNCREQTPTRSWPGDYQQILDEVEEFFTGHRGRIPSGRQLATVVLTDLVRSTDPSAEVGDAAWVDLIRRHDTIVRELLRQFRGEELGHTGDGVLAVFDGPTRAVTFAARAVEAARDSRTDDARRHPHRRGRTGGRRRPGFGGPPRRAG
jgi:pimeloyl-ACP methyl ester carboxylesterase